LGIIDAVSKTLLQTLATTPGAHSVSVDPISGEVFVPFGAPTGRADCPNGCIGVFALIGAGAANVCDDARWLGPLGIRGAPRKAEYCLNTCCVTQENPLRRVFRCLSTDQLLPAARSRWRYGFM